VVLIWFNKEDALCLQSLLDTRQGVEGYPELPYRAFEAFHGGNTYSSPLATPASIWQTYSNASPTPPFAPLRDPTPSSKSPTMVGNQESEFRIARNKNHTFLQIALRHICVNAK